MLKNSYLNFLFSTVKARVEKIIGAQIDYAILNDYIDEYLASLHHRHTSESFALNFSQKCPLHNAITKDYYLKIVNDTAGKFLVSLRFKGLNPEKPFLMIDDYGFQTINEIYKRISMLSQNQYPMIKIEKLLFYSCEYIENDPNIRIDKYFVGGLIKDIGWADDGTQLNQYIEIECPSELTNEEYEIYRREYGLFFQLIHN